jgi:hypothetical protein
VTEALVCGGILLGRSQRFWGCCNWKVNMVFVEVVIESLVVPRFCE